MPDIYRGWVVYELRVQAVANDPLSFMLLQHKLGCVSGVDSRKVVFASTAVAVVRVVRYAEHE
jgi:hypothetical protein